MDSDLASMYVSIFSQLPVHTSDEIARNREADAFTATRLAHDQSVQADDTAGDIHERAAAVSRIDGRIGLYIEDGIIGLQLPAC